LEFSRSKIDTGDGFELNQNLNLPVSVITSGARKAIDKAESSSNYDTIKREINKPLKVTGVSEVDLVSEICVPETILQPYQHDFKDTRRKVKDARPPLKRTHTYQPRASTKIAA
jgi:hypothetical protein